MPDLAPRDALAGLALPATSGATLAAAQPAPLWEIAPRRGRAEALAVAFGLAALPAPGASAAVSGGTLLWAGLDRYLLRGPAAPPPLAGLAAVVDQSDGWAGLVLAGPAAADVLARLLPLDLAGLPPGAVALSALRHAPCLLVGRADGFELLTRRSYAAAAVADIADAMSRVAARASLG